MQYLSVAFKSLNVRRDKMNPDGSHPCHSTAMRLWPLIVSSLSNHGRDTRVVERTNQCLRYVVRCLGMACLPIIPEVISVMESFFAATQHGSCLYVTDGIVEVLLWWTVER